MKKTITTKEISDLCGLGERRLRQLAEEGHLPAPARGEWVHPQTLQKLFAYYKTRAERIGGELAQAKLDREQARARIARVAADEAEKRVWSKESVCRSWMRCIIAAKMKFGANESALSAEAAMRLNLPADQVAAIREIHARLNRGALSELNKHEWGDISCPNCHKPVKEL